MAEKKVASRQERLMFEQLIRQDMQNGIQRTISKEQYQILKLLVIIAIIIKIETLI